MDYDEELYKWEYNTRYSRWCKKRKVKKESLKTFIFMKQEQRKRRIKTRKRILHYFHIDFLWPFLLIFIAGLAGLGYSVTSGLKTVGYMFSAFVVFSVLYLMKYHSKPSKTKDTKGRESDR